jgi:hypothetical protein
VEKLVKGAELYKCIMLTIIAVLLARIWLDTPVPFTLANVRSKKVNLKEVPIVHIGSGDVDVTGTVSIDR